MTIRPAVIGDVPRLVAMGQRFRAETRYQDLLVDNPAQFAAMATRLIEGPASVVLVTERDGLVVGMLGMLCYPHHLSGVAMAGEVMWWLEPEARGHGQALLAAGEQWAADNGAAIIQMVAPSARVGQLYERRGYALIELAYQKPVKPAVEGVA